MLPRRPFLAIAKVDLRSGGGSGTVHGAARFPSVGLRGGGAARPARCRRPVVPLLLLLAAPTPSSAAGGGFVFIVLALAPSTGTGSAPAAGGGLEDGSGLPLLAVSLDKLVGKGSHGPGAAPRCVCVFVCVFVCVCVCVCACVRVCVCA